MTPKDKDKINEEKTEVKPEEKEDLKKDGKGEEAEKEISTGSEMMSVEAFVASRVDPTIAQFAIGAIKNNMKNNNDTEENKPIQEWEVIYNKLYNS